MSWALAKIFATGTNGFAGPHNTDVNVMVLDNFVTSCFSTYKDVVRKVSFNQEMSEQVSYQVIMFPVSYNYVGNLHYQDFFLHSSLI